MLLMVVLVWGATIRMAYANRLFNEGKYDQARKIYEDMAVDAPKSPYILHNQALPDYQPEDYQKSIEKLTKANQLLEAERLNPQSKNRLTNRFQYHLGNSFFKTASKAQPEQTHAMYQQALECYRKAIEADPKDMAAKYNYELTRLRLKSQPQPKQKPQPQSDAENLLNTAKQDEKYQIQVPISDAPVDKDW
jgi:tetratricopeptide (TPR) repeat protein